LKNQFEYTTGVLKKIPRTGQITFYKTGWSFGCYFMKTADPAQGYLTRGPLILNISKNLKPRFFDSRNFIKKQKLMSFNFQILKKL
jgi:hypothetical protein